MAKGWDYWGIFMAGLEDRHEGIWSMKLGLHLELQSMGSSMVSFKNGGQPWSFKSHGLWCKYALRPWASIKMYSCKINMAISNPEPTPLYSILYPLQWSPPKDRENIRYRGSVIPYRDHFLWDKGKSGIACFIQPFEVFQQFKFHYILHIEIQRIIYASHGKC